MILDVLTEDAAWYAWSAAAVEEYGSRSALYIDPIIYAEVSVRFEAIEDLEAALREDLFRRLQLPWEAAFLAPKAFLQYRRRGGVRESALPDFFIGAHAAVAGLQLLTRNERHYRDYLPSVTLISPAA